MKILLQIGTAETFLDVCHRHHLTGDLEILCLETVFT